MERVSLEVPMMYGDHHVLRVRALLGEVTGVHEVVASAARRRVVVSYDDAQTSPEAIEKVLAEAGYTDDADALLPRWHRPNEDGTYWYNMVQRVTGTRR